MEGINSNRIKNILITQHRQLTDQTTDAQGPQVEVQTPSLGEGLKRRSGGGQPQAAKVCGKHGGPHQSVRMPLGRSVPFPLKNTKNINSQNAATLSSEKQACPHS